MRAGPHDSLVNIPAQYSLIGPLWGLRTAVAMVEPRRPMAWPSAARRLLLAGLGLGLGLPPAAAMAAVAPVWATAGHEFFATKAQTAVAA